MIWDGEMAKPNDVDLKELYIFVADNFSIWISHNLKFKIF